MQPNCTSGPLGITGGANNDFHSPKPPEVGVERHPTLPANEKQLHRTYASSAYLVPVAANDNHSHVCTDATLCHSSHMLPPMAMPSCEWLSFALHPCHMVLHGCAVHAIGVHQLRMVLTWMPQCCHNAYLRAILICIDGKARRSDANENDYHLGMPRGSSERTVLATATHSQSRRCE